MDPSAVPFLDLADRIAAEHAALADAAAGRVIGCDAVVRWLGGWAMAQRAVGAGDGPGGIGGDAPVPVVWTDTAVRRCDRLRLQLARLGDDDGQPFAATLVAAMVALSIDGADGPPRVDDIAIGAALTVRVAVEADRVVVLDVRWDGVGA